MMFRAPLLIAALVLSLTVTAGAQDAPTYLLRYKFAAGTTLKYRETLRGDYEIRSQDTIETPYSEQQSTKSLHVVSLAENGNAIVVPVIDKVESLVTFDAGQKFVFQQIETPNEPLVFSFIRALQGKRRVKLTISPIGEVVSVAPADEELKEVAVNGEVVDDLDEAAAHALAVYPRLPAEQVAVKGQWKYHYEVKVPVPDSETLKMPVKMMQSFTLQSVENGKATITYQTFVLTPITDPALAVQFLQRKPRGTFELDLARGVVLAHRVAQEEAVVGYSGAATSIKFKQDRSETLLTDAAAGNGPAMR